MPNAATRALFERAAHHNIAMNFGYAELTPDGHHFNTCILTDKSAKIVGKYRKVHLPGHSEFDTERAFQLDRCAIVGDPSNHAVDGGLTEVEDDLGGEQRTTTDFQMGHGHGGVSQWTPPFETRRSQEGLTSLS